MYPYSRPLTACTEKEAALAEVAALRAELGLTPVPKNSSISEISSPHTSISSQVRPTSFAKPDQELLPSSIMNKRLSWLNPSVNATPAVSSVWANSLAGTKAAAAASATTSAVTYASSDNQSSNRPQFNVTGKASSSDVLATAAAFGITSATRKAEEAEKLKTSDVASKKKAAELLAKKATEDGIRAEAELQAQTRVRQLQQQQVRQQQVEEQKIAEIAAARKLVEEVATKKASISSPGKKFSFTAPAPAPAPPSPGPGRRNNEKPSAAGVTAPTMNLVVGVKATPKSLSTPASVSSSPSLLRKQNEPVGAAGIKLESNSFFRGPVKLVEPTVVKMDEKVNRPSIASILTAKAPTNNAVTVSSRSAVGNMSAVAQAAQGNLNDKHCRGYIANSFRPNRCSSCFRDVSDHAS